MLSTDDIQREIARQTEMYDEGKFDSYFKYFSDDSKVIDGIFKEQKIRFTQPRALNDPLEFSPTMRFHDSRAKYQWYELNGVLLPSIELFFRVLIIESQINRYGILSVTKIPNSFDMWSRYANGHKGFIIEFKDNFWRNPCMKSKTGDEYSFGRVEYVDDYSINLDDIAGTKKQIPIKVLHKELFFKKTSRWNHEHEYRLVRPLSDSPDYRPPETYYPYTDVNVYLFPYEWGCVASVTLGASMTTENKTLIVRCLERHKIPWFQAHIIRDIKDLSGKPTTVYILSPAEYESKDIILQAKPQLFCTDSVRLGNRSVVRINKIADLPYYKGYEKFVNQILRNLKADGSV